jgi:hypothetical protein
MEINSYELIEINDQHSECSCCGKKGLTKVAWLLNTETNEENHYGVICASKLLSKIDKSKLCDLSYNYSKYEYFLKELIKKENNINDWFICLQRTFAINPNLKTYNKDYRDIISYLQVYISRGKSICDASFLPLFNELEFVNYNDLLTTSKDIINNKKS